MPTRKSLTWDKLQAHTAKLEAELAFLQRTIVDNYTLRERMDIIDKEYGLDSIHVQCEALKVARGTYLNHRLHNKNDTAWFKRREAEYTEIITRIHEESGHVYGPKKITAIMHKQGKPVSDRYVRKLMIENGLSSVRSPFNKNYAYVSRHLREASHASQDFKVDRINQVWVSDTSAIYIHGRYYYICVYIDLFSRKVVGWGLGRSNSTQLVKRTFQKAFKARKNPKNLIIHTDNGMCYSSYSLNRLFQKLKLTHSYSRVGIPHDNAVAESFYNTLKREAIYLEGSPVSYRDLEKRISSYIDRYNTIRPHEHLNYDSPDDFEKKHAKKAQK